MSHAVSKNRVREFLPNNWSEVDTLLGHFFGPTYSGVRSASTGRSPLAPASFWEAEDAYHVEVDLPGVAREDVEITFDKGELKIAAERKSFRTETEEGSETPPRKGLVEERVYGKVERSVTLPDSVDADSIEAKFENGVLSVTIAKLPEVQPKRVEIK